jgi:hypothetical protein
VIFSKSVGLTKTQPELDFVDVHVNKDLALFVDPFAISLRKDPWSHDCHDTITHFFQRVLDAIRTGRNKDALELLSFLREPNETRLGLSSRKPKGAGIGAFQANALLDALSASSAVKTGFITSLQDCELMVEGIGRDKISDLTTNIIRKKLAEYTKQQCDLLGIPTYAVPLPPFYDVTANQWSSAYFPLPVVQKRPVLLVPKLIARFDPSYNHVNYYDDFVVTFLQHEALTANSSLVRTLKNGRRRVFKKDIKERFPCTKENLFRFSKDHPEILAAYRSKLAEQEHSNRFLIVGFDEEMALAEALCDALQKVPPGPAAASDYHSLMLGILEFLFFPSLTYPKKECEIHQGRKRIDVTMNNVAVSGTFYFLHQVRHIPCPYVMFECKNYRTDIANPEIDQIAGRFSSNRGQFGMICCRTFEDRSQFIERCRDTFKDGRGLIIPLDDATVLRMLQLIADNKRRGIEDILVSLIDEVCLA